MQRKKQIQIKLKSNLSGELKIFTASVIENLKHLNIDFKTNNMPTKNTVFTFLRSPHVHKKSKDQYALKMFESSITLPNVEENIDQIQNLFLKNKPLSVKVVLKYKI